MHGCINDAGTERTECNLKKTQPLKVLVIMAASFCTEPVATEMLSLCMCVCVIHHTLTALKSFLPLPFLGLCVLLFILQPSTFHICPACPGTWMFQQTSAGLRERTNLSLVFKTERLALWSGLVPTIPLAVQKDLELQKMKLCSPWLQVKGHIGTIVAKRAIFQQDKQSGQAFATHHCCKQPWDVSQQ